MSIEQDYSMYYHDTYVALPLNDGVYPFYVDSVEFSEEALEECEREGESSDSFFDYLYERPDEVSEVLVFSGHYYDAQGNTHYRGVMMDELDLENPKLGYIYDEGEWHWYTYATNQSVKKGLCHRRLNQNRDLTGMTLYKLFNIAPQGALLDSDLLLLATRLEYKGVEIAKREGNVLSLDERFSVMKGYIERLLPEGITLEIATN